MSASYKQQDIFRELTLRSSSPQSHADVRGTQIFRYALEVGCVIDLERYQGMFILPGTSHCSVRVERKPSVYVYS
jgi:hypothetical protein